MSKAEIDITQLRGEVSERNNLFKENAELRAKLRETEDALVEAVRAYSDIAGDAKTRELCGIPRPPEPAEKPTGCVWLENKEGECWETSCQAAYCQTENIRNMGFEFCPYCGGKIVIESEETI